MAAYYTLLDYVTAKIGAQFGNIKSDAEPHFSDRFFLGGTPGSLRGFKQCSIGKFEDNCALGGATFWSAGAHLYSRMDFLSKLSGGLMQVRFVF